MRARVRLLWSALVAAALVVLLGSSASAETQTMAEPGCSGGSTITQDGTLYRYGDSTSKVITCTVDVPAGTTAEVVVKGYGWDSTLTTPATVDGAAAVLTHTGCACFGATLLTVPDLAAGTHTFTFTGSNGTPYPYLGGLEVTTTALPSPSASPSPEASPSPDPAPESGSAEVVAALEDTQQLMAWGFGLTVFALGAVMVGGWRA